MNEIQEWRKKWSHQPTPIALNASGLWYSEECVDQMLADYSTARVQQLEEQVRMLREIAQMAYDYCKTQRRGYRAHLAQKACEALKATDPINQERI